MADRHVETIVRIDDTDVLAGELWSHRRKGRESATFSYATSYLETAGAYALDPALPLVAGQQQTAAGRALFGAFTDCAPDRWGRRLIARAEKHHAEDSREAERSLGEIDFLLGGRDDMRQGALRFRDPETGAFLTDDGSGVPALIGLPRLLAASEREERGEADDADLRALLEGGSSLGGARPKAHVIDERGRPAIAKFPSPANDDWDVMRWEAVALELARAAELEVPNSRLLDIGGKAILLVDRFDREGATRIGYASAMTMLEAGDGEPGSYLEIADTIEVHSPAASEDLGQLWRRIAFSIVISNTDDHLRNHGFLRRSTAGWSLSPAFDLNPNPAAGPKHLRTAIDFDDTEARIDTLMRVAGQFRLTGDRAREVLGEVIAATTSWRRLAGDYGLTGQAVEAMAPAFEHQQADAARRVAEGTEPA